jgi:hypothetical protein
VIRGEGVEIIAGVTPQEVFDFIIDPAQYTKADTKIIWVTKLADTSDGMIAREDGKFLGLGFAKGSVITRYRWQIPHRLDVTLEHGVIRGMNAWFDIEEIDGGTRITHVEEVDFGWGPIGWLHDLCVAAWWRASVRQEVAEIARLLREGERGDGLNAI